MSFEKAIERVLGHEGGYVNDPRDPGGETNWGISKKSYPAVNIRALTREQAIVIYRRDFWDRVHGDDLPQAFSFQALDSAVNHGIKRTILLMQQAAGTEQDGLWGPLTRAAVTIADAGDLVLLFLACRLEFYCSLPTWPSYGKGWTRRIAGNLRFAAEDN